MKRRLQKLTPAQRAGYKRSVNAMKKRYEKFLKEQDEKERIEKESEIMVKNIKKTIRDAVDELKTPFIQNGADDTAKVILSMIDESVERNKKRKKYGYTITAERLADWAGDFEKKLRRLTLAVIDTKGAGRYNTNTNAFKRDEEGDVGRALYKADLEALAGRLKVSTSLLEGHLAKIM